MLKYCTQCVLPETYPGISFDETGVCRQCREYREPTVRGVSQLSETIRKYRRKNGKYDCIVALSGGRDSTYALYYAVRKLGLRVLAFSVDNGCMPQEMRDNIRHAVGILGVDLHLRKHDLLRMSLKPFLSSWFRRPSPAMIASMCLGCRYGLQRELYRAVAQHEVPFVISGGGEPEKSFAESFYGTPRWLGRRFRLAWGQAKEMAANPRYFRHPTMVYRMFMEYVYKYSPRAVRRMTRRWHGCRELHYVELFQYVPWDEEEIMSTITNELRWRKFSGSQSAWRSDCTVNAVRNYFYGRMLGFTKNNELVSNLIRQGKMTREEGWRRLEHDNRVAHGYVEEFCREHGIPYDPDALSRWFPEP